MIEKDATQDQVPLLKVKICLAENDDVLETLYTDQPLEDVVGTLREYLTVYDSKEDHDTAAREEADRG